jgi:hypothetical protein
VNNGEQTRQAQKSARPPEYIIHHKPSNGRTGERQHPPPPKKTRQSTREAQLEERLSRRAQLREHQSGTKRRRQWVLAITLVVVLIALIALARFVA